jgi:hypothetical protein
MEELSFSNLNDKLLKSGLSVTNGRQENYEANSS